MEATIKVNAHALGRLIEACAAVSNNVNEYFNNQDDLTKADLEAIVSELLTCSAVVSASALTGE